MIRMLRKSLMRVRCSSLLTLIGQSSQGYRPEACVRQLPLQHARSLMKTAIYGHPVQQKLSVRIYSYFLGSLRDARDTSFVSPATAVLLAFYTWKVHRKLIVGERVKMKILIAHDAASLHGTELNHRASN
jgi:hypothetical protein